MKKFFVLLMVAAMSIACASVEDKAKDYAKQAEDLATEMAEAQKAGDEKKIEEINKKIEDLTKEQAEWFAGLSEEDKAKALKAIGQEVVEDATKAAGAAAEAAADAAAAML